MYALFPNEARNYLTLHQEGAEQAVFMMGEEVKTVMEGEEPVDVNQIRELIKIVEMSDVNEVTVEEAGSKVVVRKGSRTRRAGSVGRAHRRRHRQHGHLRATGCRCPRCCRTSVHMASRSKLPWSGRSIVRASPGADPFVSVGDTVEEGQTLCILEAMKLMNEIAAEEPGVIREVCVG